MMYSTRIGKLQLSHPIYNAAGVWDTTLSQCQELERTTWCGATVTKSCTLNARAGNDYPKYHFGTTHFSLNSNGLENYSLDYYLQLNPTRSHPIFFSVGGLSDQERITMLCRLRDQDFDPTTAGIELNLSCPNMGCPGAAYDPQQLEECLRKTFEVTGKINLTFGLKLPPYYLPKEFDEVADVLNAYSTQIDFITCINSVPNGIDFDVDNNMPYIAPNAGYGGIGGPAVLPIGLANVRRFSQLLSDAAVIGCGGVTSGADVYKYFLAGASAVQVGTHLWKNGPEVFQQLSAEFAQIMSRKGYHSLTQISPYVR